MNPMSKAVHSKIPIKGSYFMYAFGPKRFIVSVVMIKQEGEIVNLWANSNECDRRAKTAFRLGEHEKLDKSELRLAGNCIEVSRHSTAKLNKMKTEKYTNPIKREVLDESIKMEVPDEIATDKGKLILRRRLTLRFVMCVPKNAGAG